MNKNGKIVIELGPRYLIPLSEITCSNLDDFKEEPTMQVSYNGFTGELVKLEQYSCGNGKWTYELNIYDSEKKCAHLFAGVKLEDVKFLGGAVSFGG